MQKLLPKSKLNDFIKGLMAKHQVIAPVQKGNTKFEVVSRPEDIYLEKITQVPVKKFFIPDNEVLLKFEDGKVIEPEDQTAGRVIFGLRKCDLNALQVLDKVLCDPLYLNKRRKTILIGMYCDNPDDYCFCNSMELDDDCYDLFFYPKGEEYYISIGTEKGGQLVSHLPNVKKEFVPKIRNIKVLKKKDIGMDYKSAVWKSDSDRCLSCSACTVYCPTCNCFDIRDELDINLKNGKRVRSEISCQLKSFSRVAGGKVFRESRLSRFKHFVYHKIDYFKKQHDRYMCVGCGRCLRVCPTKIDWVKTINALFERRIK